MANITGELAKVIKNLNKTMGEGTIVLGSDIRDDLLDRITTGSIAIDVALGGG